MSLLLADFIYSRDCKLNLRKNIDTTPGIFCRSNRVEWEKFFGFSEEKSPELADQLRASILFTVAQDLLTFSLILLCEIHLSDSKESFKESFQFINHRLLFLRSGSSSTKT